MFICICVYICMFVFNVCTHMQACIPKYMRA